jgi:hypothetical protein
VRVYVASSWRNPWQPGVVGLLRSLGHDVYDFRHPKEGDVGFSWGDIAAEWKGWTPEQYRRGLSHTIARAGFKSDKDALAWADACVAVQPYGTSTAMEVGWAAGAGKRTAILFPVGMPLTAIGGHSVDAEAYCKACRDGGALYTAQTPKGCLLPGKLGRVEAELMALLADTILIGESDLTEWVRDAWPGDPK